MKPADQERKARAFALRKAGRRAPPPPDPLPRIEALTKNARTTWFTLLGVLVFVGVTLMGVEHIDFYGVDRATQLPLVNVSVPTSLFFVAAPILTAAAYGYFHLYLIRLWDALGDADARIGDRPLGDAVTPWLVTDAALNLRRLLRREDPPPSARRALDDAAMVLNLLLAWGFGLVVLFFAWWLTQPARDTLMNLIAGVSLIAGLLSGGYSLFALVDRMGAGGGYLRHMFRHAPGVVVAFAGAIILLQSVVRTSEALDTLAPVDLSGEAVAEKPADWLPRDIAKRDFLALWCQRERVDCTTAGETGDPAYDVEAFEAEWRRRRAAAVAALRKPDLSGRDLRGARMADAFLTGVTLSGAQMQGADLIGAQMEGANLRGAQMEGAVLIGAQMEGADLSGAQMEGANLRGAQMQGANLRGAQMEGAVLIGAQMEGADLRGAQMEGADLSGAQMQGANLRGAQMQGADLSGAQMQGADLSGAQMQGADLRGAQMEGADLDRSLLTGTAAGPMMLQSTNLSAGTNDGGALRFVDLTAADFDAATDFRNAFLDGSVTMTEPFRAQMGNPCQWQDRVIERDAEFYGLWRTWVDRAPNNPPWSFFAPDDWRDVPPAPLDPSCQWKTGPMPGSAQPAQD